MHQKQRQKEEQQKKQDKELQKQQDEEHQVQEDQQEPKRQKLQPQQARDETSKDRTRDLAENINMYNRPPSIPSSSSMLDDVAK
ncbi:hypothetical protein ElyMa_000099600, partial [Elysia marginata]